MFCVELHTINVIYEKRLLLFLEKEKWTQTLIIFVSVTENLGKINIPIWLMFLFVSVYMLIWTNLANILDRSEGIVSVCFTIAVS